MADDLKCMLCGGPLEFDPALQKLKCPYCGSVQEELVDADANATLASNAGSEWSDSDLHTCSVYVCNSCGGELITDANTSTTKCPYCDNPIVLKGNLEGTLKPDKVIPFNRTREQAQAALQQHFKGKFLLPKVFSEELTVEEMKGLYVPFWIYDADVTGRVRFRTEDTYRDADGDTHTVTGHAIRGGTLSFDDVPVDGSQKMPDDLMQSIEPFNYKSAENFNTAYLAGFFTDKYDVDRDQASREAGRRIKSGMEESFKDTVRGHDAVYTESSQMRIDRLTSDYALFPVWLFNAVWNNNKYTFAVNGQTGKIAGDLPKDEKKFWTCALGIGLLLVLLIGGIGYALSGAAIGGIVFGLVFGIVIDVVLMKHWTSQLKSVKLRSAYSYVRRGSVKIYEKRDW